MTSQFTDDQNKATAESVIAEVIEYHADTIGTHFDGCYKHHATCLAVMLRDVLRQPAEPGWWYEYADDEDLDGNVYGQLRRVVGPWLPVEGEKP